MIQIYHNPRCGKSRNCLALMDKLDQDYEIISYLTESPDFDQLNSLLEKLNMKPIELVRSKEKIWIESYKGKELTDNQIIQAMVDNPILIERPIVVRGNKAIVGRDLEKLVSFLE